MYSVLAWRRNSRNACVCAQREIRRPKMTPLHSRIHVPAKKEVVHCWPSSGLTSIRRTTCRYLEIEWDMEFFTEPRKNTSHWDPSRQQGRLVNSCYANCRYVAHIIHLNI
ncbi:uncharacterized protein LOC143303066 [Bombus vancouverensis nearcticus]|uniref:uncharacterized protein LOC143303066 n=1 Tax=Bombus vancouverensis nearcticus TaxID=2705178 RepID=UPI00402BD943